MNRQEMDPGDEGWSSSVSRGRGNGAFSNKNREGNELKIKWWMIEYLIADNNCLSFIVFYAAFTTKKMLKI